MTCSRVCVPVFLILISTILVPTAISGQHHTSGYDFLRISPSAGQLGISQAESAHLSGAASLYSNPALLALEKRSSVDLHYTLWISGIHNQFGAVNLRRDRHAFAGGIYSSAPGGFQNTGQESVQYLSLAAGYGWNYGPFAIGITGQYIREEVFQHRANGAAISVGLAGQFLGERLRAGIALRNMGSIQDLNQESRTLPSSVAAGLDIQIIEIRTSGWNDLPILLSIHTDWVHQLHIPVTSDYTGEWADTSQINVGFSTEIGELFTFRTGLRTGETLRPFSAGIGIHIDPVYIDYATLPFQSGYGTAHSIGMRFYF